MFLGFKKTLYVAIGIFVFWKKSYFSFFAQLIIQIILFFLEYLTAVINLFCEFQFSEVFLQKILNLEDLITSILVILVEIKIISKLINIKFFFFFITWFFFKETFYFFIFFKLHCKRYISKVRYAFDWVKNWILYIIIAICFFISTLFFHNLNWKTATAHYRRFHLNFEQYQLLKYSFRKYKFFKKNFFSICRDITIFLFIILIIYLLICRCLF